MHFGMTGYLAFKKEGQNPEKHARVIFKFTNGDRLEWTNRRLLGKIYFVNRPEDVGAIGKMGPEPLEIDEEEFLNLLAKKKAKGVKAFLMNQADIGGIGNQYSDEILFRAGINPRRKVASLKDEEKRLIYESMNRVLNEAIGIGAPEGVFDASWLISHRDTDMICPLDGSELKKEMIAGRSSVFCPDHQK
jgi:formamidopyrimidine-DNA glycosylase